MLTMPHVLCICCCVPAINLVVHVAGNAPCVVYLLVVHVAGNAPCVVYLLVVHDVDNAPCVVYLLLCPSNQPGGPCCWQCPMCCVSVAVSQQSTWWSMLLAMPHVLCICWWSMMLTMPHVLCICWWSMMLTMPHVLCICCCVPAINLVVHVAGNAPCVVYLLVVHVAGNAPCVVYLLLCPSNQPGGPCCWQCPMCCVSVGGP